MSLTKKDIVKLVKDKKIFPDYPKTPISLASDIVEDLLEIMKSTLESGEDILISGFGKFCVKEKKARKGRNPSTQQEMMLSSRRVVTFQYSGALREKINS